MAYVAGLFKTITIKTVQKIHTEFLAKISVFVFRNNYFKYGRQTIQELRVSGAAIKIKFTAILRVQAYNLR